MLTLKEFDPHRIVLVDENGGETVMTATPPDEFDRDLIEDILEG